MTAEKEDGQPLSPAMRSALQAVARMKGDAAPDAVLWGEFLSDLRGFGLEKADPRQGSKPAGR